MVEAIYWSLNRPYGHDDSFRFRYGENGEKALNPLQPILDRDLCLGIVGNNNLLPHHLLPSEKDRDAIMVTIAKTGETISLSMQGKSAQIILQPDVCSREFLNKMIKIDLQGEPNRRHHLHTTKVGQVEDTGCWKAIWAPIQLKYLLPHVRLVATRTIDSGEDPTIEDAKALANIFSKIC